MRLDGADFLFNLIVAGASMSTVSFSLTCLVLWKHPEAAQAFLLDGDSTWVIKTSTWWLKAARTL